MSKLSDVCCNFKGETCRFKLDVCIALPPCTQYSCNHPSKAVQTKTSLLCCPSGRDENGQPCVTGPASGTPPPLICSHSSNCDNRKSSQANIDCGNSGVTGNAERGSQINCSGEAKSNNNYLETLECAANDLLNVLGQIHQITENDDSTESLSSLQSQLNTVHTRLVNQVTSGQVQTSRSYIGRTRNSVTFNNITRNKSDVQMDKDIHCDVKTLRNRVVQPKVASDRKCECLQQCMCGTRAIRQVAPKPDESASSGYQTNQSGWESTNQSSRLSNVGSQHYINPNQSANNEIVANQAVNVGAANNSIRNRSVRDQEVCQIINNAPVQSTSIQNNNAFDGTFVIHKKRSPILDQVDDQLANNVEFPKSTNRHEKLHNFDTNTNRSLPNEMTKNVTFHTADNQSEISIQSDGTLNNGFCEDVSDSMLGLIDNQSDMDDDEISTNGSASGHQYDQVINNATFEISANNVGLESEVDRGGSMNRSVRNQAVSQAINNASQVGGSMNRSARNQAASPAIHIATFEIVGSQVGESMNQSEGYHSVSPGISNDFGTMHLVDGSMNRSIRNQAHSQPINNASYRQYAGQSKIGGHVSGSMNRSVGNQSASPAIDSPMFETPSNQSGMASQVDRSVHRSVRNQAPSQAINNASYRQCANQSRVGGHLDGTMNRSIRNQAPSQAISNASNRHYADQSAIGGQVFGAMNRTVGNQSASPAINSPTFVTSANQSGMASHVDGSMNRSRRNQAPSQAINNASYRHYPDQSGIESQVGGTINRSAENQTASTAIISPMFEASSNQSGLPSHVDVSVNRPIRNQAPSQAVNNTMYQQYANQSGSGGQVGSSINRSATNEAHFTATNNTTFATSANNPETGHQDDKPMTQVFEVINNDECVQHSGCINQSVGNQSASPAINKATFQQCANQSGVGSQVHQTTSPGAKNPEKNIQGDEPVTHTFQVINNGTVQPPANQSRMDNGVVGEFDGFRFQTIGNAVPPNQIQAVNRITNTSLRNTVDIGTCHTSTPQSGNVVGSTDILNNIQIEDNTNNNLPQNQNQIISVLPTGTVNQPEIKELHDTPQAVYDLIQEAFDTAPFDLGIVQNFFNMIFGLKGNLSWTDLLLIIIENVATFTTVKIFNRETFDDVGHFHLDASEMEEVYSSCLLDLFEVIRNRNTLENPYAADQFTPSTVQQIMEDEDVPEKKLDEYLPETNLQYYMNCTLEPQHPIHFSIRQNQCPGLDPFF